MTETTKTVIYDDALGADDVNEETLDGTKIVAPNGDITAIEINVSGVLTSQRGSDPVKTYAEAGGGLDATAIHVDEANEITGITEETTPADDDVVVIEDISASGAKKKVQVSNLPLGDIDGGSATSTYSVSQVIDGGTA